MAVGLAVVFLIALVPVADAALGFGDTATGDGALASESGGSFNTADGHLALNANTTGISNTAVGSGALLVNSTGEDNTAAGRLALLVNSTGEDNTAVGGAALSNNTEGRDNTAVGLAALAGNTTGNVNTALGNDAGVAGNPNTTGSKNTFLGSQSGPGIAAELNNATAVGANAQVSESDALVLGAIGVKVGIGTTTPKSLLQVGVSSTSYGDYLQIPMVTSGSAPPATDCNSGGPRPIIFAGRLVLQYDAQKVRTTLWSCSAAGAWTKQAQG